MARYTNNDIRLTLSNLRSKIRNGLVNISYKKDGVAALSNWIAAAFTANVSSKDLFTSANFNPQTIRRFEKLFDVPSHTPIVPGAIFVYPSQDDTATALQNFLNRRADPWAHVRPAEVTDSLVEVQALSV